MAQGCGEDAVFLMDNFPTSREYAAVVALRPLASALSQSRDILALEVEESDSLDAAYRRTLRLVGRGNDPVLEGLFYGCFGRLRRPKQP